MRRCVLSVALGRFLGVFFVVNVDCCDDLFLSLILNLFL